MGLWEKFVTSLGGQDFYNSLPDVLPSWGSSTAVPSQSSLESGSLFGSPGKDYSFPEKGATLDIAGNIISDDGKKSAGLFSSFKDPQFLSTAIQSAVGLGSTLFADKAAQKNRDEDRRLAAQELALKAKYGLLGGGGGGGAGTSNLLNAYKAAADMNNASAQGKSGALARLMAASTNPLLKG